MLFRDVPGQNEIKDFLTRSINKRTVPPVLLFLGPEGTGKLPMAVAFARMLFCSDPSSHDACDQCASCRKINKLIHPDLHWVFPTISTGFDGARRSADSWLPDFRSTFIEQPFMDYEDWLEVMKADHRQGNIGRSDCAGIISNLGLSAFEGGFKVVILWKAEFLGEAGNLLLKTLEEPPDNTIFLLIGEHSEQILSTILSRTLIIRFAPLPVYNVEQWLVACGIPSKQAIQLAVACDGNLRKAIRLKDGGDANYSEAFIVFMRLAYNGKTVHLVKWLTDINDLGREYSKSVSESGLNLIRQVYLYKHSAIQEDKLSEIELKFVKNFVIFVNHRTLPLLREAIEDVIYRLERNGNLKLIWHELYYIFKDVLKMENRRALKATTRKVLAKGLFH